MTTDDILLLAKTYAAHIDRSLYRVALRVGVHSKFFVLLDKGQGCNSRTVPTVMAWFDANWPADLDWPVSVPRPRPAQKRRRAA
jgi:hypothetical protein